MPVAEQQKTAIVRTNISGPPAVLPCHAASKLSELLILLALCSALLSAIFLVFAGPNCHECRLAENIQLLPGLKWLGLFAYFSVLLSRLRFSAPQWNSAAILCLMGVHLCLFGYLLYFQVACLPCIVCSISIFIAALLVMVKRAVSWQFAVVAVSTSILAFAVSSAAAATFARMSMQNDVKAIIDFAHLTRLPGSSLTLYAFTSKSCRHCFDLEQIDLKAIKASFGDRVSIAVQKAPPKLQTLPAIVLIGQRKELIIGRPQKTTQLLRQIKGCMLQN